MCAKKNGQKVERDRAVNNKNQAVCQSDNLCPEKHLR